MVHHPRNLLFGLTVSQPLRKVMKTIVINRKNSFTDSKQIKLK